MGIDLGLGEIGFYWRVLDLGPSFDPLTPGPSPPKGRGETLTEVRRKLPHTSAGEQGRRRARSMLVNMKRSIRVIALVLIGFAALSVLVFVQTRSLFIPMETELTGLTFDLSETAFFWFCGCRAKRCG